MKYPEIARSRAFHPGFMLAPIGLTAMGSHICRSFVIFKGTYTKTSKGKSDGGKLDLGDILGRSKDGFKPLKQDDDDEDDRNTASSDDDDDDLEEFSVPALRA